MSTHHLPCRPLDRPAAHPAEAPTRAASGRGPGRFDPWAEETDARTDRLIPFTRRRRPTP